MHRFVKIERFRQLLALITGRSASGKDISTTISSTSLNHRINNTTANSISSVFIEWLLNIEKNLTSAISWLVFNQGHGLVYNYQQSTMSCPATNTKTELYYFSSSNSSSSRTKQRGKGSSNSKDVLEKSTTLVNGVTVEFTPEDRSHPRSKEIYAERDLMEAEIAEYERYHNADYHAERLALAFNFVHNPKATFVQLVTNLRMCPSCHAYMKAVAELKQCEIVVRDANRIHRFDKSGQCSCKDHF